MREYLADVSMTMTGTRSGNISSGNLVGGRVGGTLVGKASAAAVTIRLDFPVPRSPATTIRTAVGELELAAEAPPDIDTIGGGWFLGLLSSLSTNKN